MYLRQSIPLLLISLFVQMANSDLIIIGGGPGGYKTAEYAASKGISVTIFESGFLGGTCLNAGCIPTKALARSAEVAWNIRNAQEFGIKGFAPSPDIKDIIARKDSIVANLRQGISSLLSRPGITLVPHKAEFVSPNTLADSETGEIYKAKNIIIAAGSTHKILPLDGISQLMDGDDPLVLTSDSILNINHLPESLCIIGAGVIGMELASIFSLLGSQVSVVEYMKECIPSLDREIAKRLRKAMEKRGIKFYMQSEVSSISRKGENAVITFRRKGLQQESLEARKVLMAVGRRPITDGYGLELSGIEYDSKGIKTDSYSFQTNVAGIYAIGDVNGRLMLAHAAIMQGKRAVNHILDLLPDGIRSNIIPAAIFTFPEAACVGKSEEDAADIPVSVLKAFHRSNGRAQAMGETDGMVKVLADKESGQIIGCHAYGAQASQLVQEVSSLMCFGIKANQLAMITHIHPTISELLQELR